MKKKRGQNQGSAYQRSSDKRWVGQVTSQNKHYMKYFSTQREAETWVRQALLKIGQGIPLAGTQASIEEYFTSWLVRIAPTLRPKTLIQYEQVVHKHILPEIGHHSMKDLTAEQIQELYNSKRRAGYGNRTIVLINCILHHALEDAVANNLLFSNPVKKIPKPRRAYHEQTP